MRYARIVLEVCAGHAGVGVGWVGTRLCADGMRGCVSWLDWLCVLWLGWVYLVFGLFMQLTNSDSLQQVLQRSDHDLTYWRRNSCILQLRLKENDAVNALLIR